MSKKTICKNENCPLCKNCAQSYIEDDELVIMCSLELSGYDEVDGDACPQYRPQGRDEDVDGAMNEFAKPKKTHGSDSDDYSPSEGDAMAADKKSYVFVGNRLVEVKSKKEGQETVELEASMADAWNAAVANEESETSKEIDRIKADRAEKINIAKNHLVDGEFITIGELFSEDEEGVDEYDEDEYEDDIEGEDDDDIDDDDEPVVKKVTSKKKSVAKKVVKKVTTKKGKK